ncbi:SDR family NAD(P)-dependent oxidoreductase [Roseobacter weihaiensis]|uniref:SDR family NAD(P)-dependent oxidoreductase n=1 Tax=Roseobacter weihaiensis TaxID=2763262 RepID=UPI001D0BB224|nr:glucose 1-dehydrogenase [Roseobacter sp. H9]
MTSMQGKVALITGGSSGIGQATAVALAKEGVKTVISGRSSAGLKKTISEVNAAGGKIQSIEADLMDPASIERLVADAASAFGQLDYVINSAGTQGEVNIFADQRLESYEEVFATNVRGTFLVMKHAIPHLLKQGGGAIVNLSSGGGLVGVPGASVYCASKHAIMGLTKVAAIDYAKQGIRVNAVNPGGIDTPMLRKFFESIPDEGERKTARAGFDKSHPIGRTGTADEVAEAVVFLCSPKASNIVGIALSVDGGYVAN